MAHKVIQNAVLINPENGKPFRNRVPVTNDDGDPLDKEGRVIEPRTPGVPIAPAAVQIPDSEVKAWTLFSFILDSLGKASTEKTKWDDLEKYGRLAKRIRKAQSNGLAVEEQSIPMNRKNWEWLEATCKRVWPDVCPNRDLCIAAGEALLGEMDEADEED